MAGSPLRRYRLPEPLNRLVNTDGDRHPVENTVALAALALGVVAVLALALRSYDVAAWLGLAGALAAACDELISKTYGERRLILVAFLLCLAGLAGGMAGGGLV